MVKLAYVNCSGHQKEIKVGDFPLPRVLYENSRFIYLSAGNSCMLNTYGLFMTDEKIFGGMTVLLHRVCLQYTWLYTNCLIEFLYNVSDSILIVS